MRLRVCAIFLMMAFTAGASGSVNQASVGSFIGSGLTGSAPGVPFSIDYRSAIANGVPYDLRQTNLQFFAGLTHFIGLNIQLNSSPTIFTLDPMQPNLLASQVQYMLYDPAMTIPPSGPSPTGFLLLPQEWRDEGADGILSGHMWVTDPSGGNGQFTVATTSFFAVPEPSTGLVIVAGALAILRRHRKKT